MRNSSPEPHNLASANYILKEILLSRGIDPKGIYEEAGIDIDALKVPNARIPSTKATQLWRLAIQRINDPCFAVDSGRHWHPSFLNALGYSWLVSSTLKDALEKLVRYSRLVSDLLKIDLRHFKTESVLRITNSTPNTLGQHRKIAFFSVLTAMCRFNFGNRFCPLELHLTGNHPECLQDFYSYFNCKIIFQAPHDSISFARTDLEKPLKTANKILEEMHDKVIRNYLQQLNEKDLAQKVAIEIAEGLSSGKVTDDFIAKRLNMSVRSMQRRLREKGTRFQKIFDSTRENMAKEYFKDPNLSLQEISYLTGFADYSSFSKAFKKWTGVSPSKMRNPSQDKIFPI